jgi:large subunit ribosomal protein L35
MPKLKTRKTAAKRVKMTGTGKFMRRKAGRRHLLTCKSAKRKRHLRKDVVVSKSDERRIKRSLPYGI